MIGVNGKKVGEKKIKNKIGGDTNESRFGGIEREMRTKKVMTIPSVNTNGTIKMEQGWNKTAVNRDIVKITMFGNSLIVERTYLEQALASMSQGDEILKYTGPAGL